MQGGRFPVKPDHLYAQPQSRTNNRADIFAKPNGFYRFFLRCSASGIAEHNSIISQCL